MDKLAYTWTLTGAIGLVILIAAGVQDTYMMWHTVYPAVMGLFIAVGVYSLLTGAMEDER